MSHHLVALWSDTAASLSGRVCGGREGREGVRCAWGKREQGGGMRGVHFILD